MFERRPSKVLRTSSGDDMMPRQFLGLADEIAWERRGTQTRDLPTVKMMTDLNAVKYLLQRHTTVVVSVEEIRLFDVYNHETVRFRFRRPVCYGEEREEEGIRQIHFQRLEVIEAITKAITDDSSSTLTTVSFIPGELDHGDYGMHVLKDCWQTELSTFCSSLVGNHSIRNVHIANKLCQDASFNLNIRQLLASSLVEISLPVLKKQGWQDLAVALATNRTLRALTLCWNAEGVETFLQTRLSTDQHIGVNWTKCNRTLRTLVISCPRELSLETDARGVASMLLKVDCVSNFVIEYFPLEPAPGLLRFASLLHQSLLNAPHVRALHLLIPFRGREIPEHFLKTLIRSPGSTPAYTSLTGLVLIPDRWTKSDLAAVGNMLKENTTLRHFGIRHQNPKKEPSFWRCVQRISETDIVGFLDRLHNSSLLSLTLQGWGVVDGKKVLAAIKLLLQRRPLLNIELAGTGLAKRNMLEPVYSLLHQRRAVQGRFFEEVQSSHSASPCASLEGGPCVSILETSNSKSASSTSGSSFVRGNAIFEGDSEPSSGPGSVWRSASLEKPERPCRSMYNSMFFSRYKYDQVTEATQNFKTLIGQGGYGKVYEGEIKSNNLKVAVKVLRLDNISEEIRQRLDKSFEAEMKTIGKIDHVNLVRLVGYCSEREQHMLIYEFMPNSSLEKWIFNTVPQRLLDWETRNRIAKGIARGLDYLHDGCNQRIIHLDIKPQNILLDESMNPKLADFGIAKLVDMDSNRAMVTLALGTRCYMAPETSTQDWVTTKSDVYSYGLLLMELVRGKKNSNMQPKESGMTFFPAWAKDRVESGSFTDVYDELKTSEHIIPGYQIESAGRMLCIAIECIQEHINNRPHMKTVLQMLEHSAVTPATIHQNGIKQGLRYKR